MHRITTALSCTWQRLVKMFWSAEEKVDEETGAMKRIYDDGAEADVEDIWCRKRHSRYSRHSSSYTPFGFYYYCGVVQVERAGLSACHNILDHELCIHDISSTALLQLCDLCFSRGWFWYTKMQDVEKPACFCSTGEHTARIECTQLCSFSNPWSYVDEWTVLGTWCRASQLQCEYWAALSWVYVHAQRYHARECIIAWQYFLQTQELKFLIGRALFKLMDVSLQSTCMK